MSEKTIPKLNHNVQRNALIKAEQAILGSLFVSPDLFRCHKLRVTEDMFYCDVNKAAFRAAKEAEYWTRGRIKSYPLRLSRLFIDRTELDKKTALDYYQKLIKSAVSDIPTLRKHINTLKKERENNFEGWKTK